METLTVPGTLDSLSPIASYVMDAARQANLDKKRAYKLRLAVDEIVSNSIIHGYQEAGLTGDLTLSMAIENSTLTLVVEDSGLAYDPMHHNLPTEDDLGKSLMQREHGGLGIYLVLEGVDDFRYERIGDRNRNIFVMTHSVETTD